MAIYKEKETKRQTKLRSDLLLIKKNSHAEKKEKRKKSKTREVKQAVRDAYRKEVQSLTG